MLGIKILDTFQNPTQYIGSGTLESRPAPHVLTDEVNRFDFFQKFLDLSVDNVFDKQYFFPVFLKAHLPDKKAQLFAATDFVKRNKELFISKKLILLIVDILEAMDKPDADLVDEMAVQLKDICNVYLLDGDKFRDSQQNNFKHYYAMHWVHHALNGEPEEIIGLEENHKTFIFLNKMGRCHRVHTINEVLKNGLRDHGYITFTKETKCCGQWPEWYPLVKRTVFDILDIQDVLGVNPTQYVPTIHCKKSFLFLNTETYCDGTRLFITEKTFKPIRIGMPFVTVANPGTLEYLKSLGFQTFSEWIDESYDGENNEDKKINTVVKEVVRFSKMKPTDRLSIRKEMESVLLHNKKLVEEMTYGKTHIEDILEDISRKERI